MANWSSIGHGMRRRMGAPSNHHEAGTNMTRVHKTADEAHAEAAMYGSSRISIGTAMTSNMNQVDELNSGQYQGTLIPKKNTQSADPSDPGSKQNRVNIERVGATYRVHPKATFVELDPAAGPTMANARIVPSIQGRVNPNFDSGIQSSY